MTDKKRTRNPNAPLTTAQAADKIIALIAQAPDEVAIAERIRAAVAEERAAVQAKIDALASRVPVGPRASLPAVVKAMLNGANANGFALFSDDDLGTDVPAMTAAEIDEATEALPKGAQPFVEGPAARAAMGGRS